MTSNATQLNVLCFYCQYRYDYDTKLGPVKYIFATTHTEFIYMFINILSVLY